MGITISHRFAQQAGYIKSTLDAAEEYARNLQETRAKALKISFSIRRIDETCLLIDIGECETLSLDFKSWTYWEAKARPKPEGEGWSYKLAVLGDFKHLEENHRGEHYEKWPDQKLLWSADFCKTQFASSVVEHKWVADILKIVASRCIFAMVDDEGDYYHTGTLEDATKSIEENGKLIDSIGGMLGNLGYENMQIVKGGETKVKSRKKRMNRKEFMDLVGEDPKDMGIKL